MKSTKKTRLYTFIPGAKVESAKVNAELNQLIGSQNDVVDDLTDINSTLTTKANATDAVSRSEIQGIILGQIPDGSVTLTKLAFDPATQAELDTHAKDYTLQIPYGGVTTSVGNAYSIGTPAITSLFAGMAISIKCNTASSGNVTLNWCSTGAKNVLKANGVAVNSWKTNGVYTLRYDGTNFILQGEGASGNAVASDLLSGRTASADAGDITGTMPEQAGLDVIAVATQSVSQMVYLRPPVGHYDGNTGWVHAGDANFVSQNIVSGVSIFGLAGSKAPGKQFATGTITSSASTTNFTLDDGASTVIGMYNIIVSGLTFTPSRIIAKFKGGATPTTEPNYAKLVVYDSSGLNNTGGANTGVIETVDFNSSGTSCFNGGAHAFRLANSAYVNGTGFCLPVDSNTPSQSYEWVAYE